jgi:hypothetical protein
MVTADDMADAVREYRLEAEDALHALLTLLEGPPRVVGGRDVHRKLTRVLADFGQAFAPLMDDSEGE